MRNSGNLWFQGASSSNLEGLPVARLDSDAASGWNPKSGCPSRRAPVTETLVDELEAQHRKLTKVAEELDAAVAVKDAALAGQKLTVVRKLLTAHLQLEEAQLYPELHASTAGKDSDQEMVTLF